MTKGCIRLGVIPARVGSTRFPNKVLALINQKPMIQYVWEAAQHSRLLSEVLVATEDLEVAKAVESFGGRVVLTPRVFDSGTDRVAYVARHYPAETVINLQADEPLLRSEDIDALIAGLEIEGDIEMATLAVKKNSLEELNNQNVVKVLVSEQGLALEFSRKSLSMDSTRFSHQLSTRAGDMPVISGVLGPQRLNIASAMPHLLGPAVARTARHLTHLATKSGEKCGLNGHFLKHIGIYAFRHEALMRFCALPKSSLEVLERLEQLRALEAGFKIRVVQIEKDTVAVDTPEDLIKVQGFFAGNDTLERVP